MEHRERWVIATILFGTALLVGFDLLTDSREGVRWWHLSAEGMAALAALAGVILLLRGAFALRRSLADETKRSAAFEAEAEDRKSTRLNSSHT